MSFSKNTADDYSKLKGQIVEDTSSHTRIVCTQKCMSLPCICQGILFNKSKPLDSRCKQVHTGQKCINQSELNGYTFYYSNDMKQIGIGIKVSSCWNSGYATRHFPLDDIGSGVAKGEIPGNIQFVSGGVIGNTLYNPTAVHDNAAYLELGMFPSGNYCFPEPAICPDGVSFSLWLNVLGDTGNWQCFITTAPHGGPGFSMSWNPDPAWGFYFEVRRDNDTFTEWIHITSSDFMTNFGYNTWHHYVITYMYDGSNNGNNMEAFIDGLLRPDSGKITQAGFDEGPNTANYDGRLQLGVYLLDSNAYRGNMKMDDILIWERKISSEDVKRLYEAYPCV